MQAQLYFLKYFDDFYQDFATRSLKMSEESPVMTAQQDDEEEDDDQVLQRFQMRRTWESRYCYQTKQDSCLHRCISFVLV